MARRRRTIDQEPFMHVIIITCIEWLSGLFAIYTGAKVVAGISSSSPGFSFLGVTFMLIGVVFLCLVWLRVCLTCVPYSDGLNGEKVVDWLVVCWYVPLSLVLLAMAIFALAVSSQGGGKSIPGRSYQEYHVESYSKWMQHKVNDVHNWDTYYKKAVIDGNVCYKFNKDYKLDSLDAFHKRKLSPFESGCCKPQEDCSFNYTSPTTWIKPEIGNYSNIDCNRWDNDPNTLCYDCQSCKAAFLQEVKSNYFYWSIVWILFFVPFTIVVIRILVICYQKYITNDNRSDYTSI